MWAARRGGRRGCHVHPRRDGGRHPGLQERVALRGAPRERRSRPVRLVRSGFLPGGRSRRRQWGVPWTPRRGTSSAYATKAYAPEPGGTARTAPRGRVLHSVQGPAHRRVTRSRARLSRASEGLRARGRSSRPVSKGTGRLARGSRGTRSGPGSHIVGKLGEIPEEPRAGLGRPDAARLAARRHAALARKRKCPRRPMRQNRDGGRGLLPRTRGHGEPRTKCPYVVAVAEVVRRRQVSNKLARNDSLRSTASEKRTSTSERGPSTARASAAGIARCSLSAFASGERAARTGSHRSGLDQGAGPGKSQGGVRASLGGPRRSKELPRIVGPG